MRLNGWQRLGIVLSIIWALSAAIYVRHADVERAETFGKINYEVCLDSKSLAHDNDLASCEQEREKEVAVWLKGSWLGSVAFMALVPIPLGWLAAFILIYFGRAQVIGFRAVVPWATLTLPKKAFVAFSVLSSLAVVLFGILVVLNLYVDTQVPVALAFLKVMTGNDMVTAEGTWTRSGLTKGSAMGYPLQTSRIQCYRQERRCTEARAYVANNELFSELVEYNVESWSPTTIVLRNDALCATEVFTIDLNTKSVNGSGHLFNKDSKFCKRYAGKEEHWNYRLSDGFEVYWAERQKARPLPLRLIHTFFGN
jgi:hypothetical protein